MTNPTIHALPIEGATDRLYQAGETPPPQPVVAVALVSTRHFQFIATGDSQAAARAALKAAWLRHAAELGADPRHVADDDIAVVSGPVGSVWRDGSLYPKGHN